MSTSDTATDSLRSPKRSRRKLFLGAIALVIFGAGGWYYWQSTGEQETSNQPLIVTVGMGNIENTITASGSLQPFDFVDVGAQV
ncbi:MAG: efflux transporter periplasmic adaptor subunit, partial [Gammaproteobacteria bacterium]|nr:efflux transporter periplasmic adaptor subunit [Gammaproteobacteria bacterium]